MTSQTAEGRSGETLGERGGGVVGVAGKVVNVQ